MSDDWPPRPKNADLIDFLTKARFTLQYDQTELMQHDWLVAIYKLAHDKDVSEFDWMVKKYGRPFIGSSKKRGRPSSTSKNDYAARMKASQDEFDRICREMKKTSSSRRINRESVYKKIATTDAGKEFKLVFTFNREANKKRPTQK